MEKGVCHASLPSSISKRRSQLLYEPSLPSPHRSSVSEHWALCAPSSLEVPQVFGVVLTSAVGVQWQRASNTGLL